MFLKCPGRYIYQSDDHFSGGSRTTCGFRDFVCLQHATVVVNSPMEVSKNWLGLASRRWFVPWKLRQTINADSKQVVRQRHNYAVAIKSPLQETPSFNWIRETTLALLNCPNFCVTLQYRNNRFSLARTHFQNGTCGTRILSGTLPRVEKWMELSLIHTGDLRIILLQPQRVRNVEHFIVDAWNKL